MVVSLPMRDGNLAVSEVRSWGEAVVSLPMRDGNFYNLPVMPSTMWVVSLPMRDGNHMEQARQVPTTSLLAYL